MSPITASSSSLKRTKIPTRLFVKSGPCKTSSFIDVPQKATAQSNTIRNISGLFSLTTLWWEGAKSDQVSHLFPRQALSLLNPYKEALEFRPCTRRVTRGLSGTYASTTEASFQQHFDYQAN